MGAAAWQRLLQLLRRTNSSKWQRFHLAARLTHLKPAIPIPGDWYDGDYFEYGVKSNWTDGYKTPILAFASSGDGGFGVGYPSTNPWVISAGGTSILRNSATLKMTSESCWGGSGGGESTVETYTTSWSGGNAGPWAGGTFYVNG